jgi:hypothetical protein
MNYLLIDNKPWTSIRFGIGVLVLIAGIAYFFANIHDLKAINYVVTASFIVSGIFNMANDFGLSKTYLKIADDKLIVKHINSLGEKSLSTSDIKSISLKKTQVDIILVSGKIIKIKIGSFNQIERNQIYSFFNNYSREHEVLIGRS